MRASVSARPCASTKPTTTSRPLPLELVRILEHLITSCRRPAPRQCTDEAARVLLP